MLVDSHHAVDFADFINTDLFAANASASASPPSDNDSSPPQSPFQNLLTTPPQDMPPSAFPDFSLPSGSLGGSGLQFLDHDSLKGSSFDFMSLAGMQMNYPDMMDLSMGFNMDAVLPIQGTSSSDLASYLGIDPAFVGTPAPSVSTSELETVEEDEESSHEAQPTSQKQQSIPEDQRERLTLTITPAKVGGHGKSRKGTVQSGGIVKKSVAPPHVHTSRDSSLLATTSAQSAATIAANAAALKKAKFRASSEVSSVDDIELSFRQSDGSGATSPTSNNKEDLAIDWRPAPEVLAKMSSKEKRQLRNKISARNFRVRRKEYITTLEGDIAERDRLLDSIRSELGSTQSENLALRQEIAALKKILLEGRGTESLASLNLPAPAPLAVSTPGSVSVITPAIGAGFGSGSGVVVELSTSASAVTPTSGVIDPTLALHSSATNANVSLALPTPTSSPQPSSSSLGLLTPNTQKDLPTSPRLGAAAFWGGTTRPSFGMGMGGGVTPVHSVFIPDLSQALGAGKAERSVTRALQENINPALNGVVAKNINVSTNFGAGLNAGGFEGWADSNPLTMKTLDAYRMHLWGKMAAQQHFQRSQHSQTHRSSTTSQLTSLASSLRPHFFASTSSYPSPPSTPPLPYSYHGSTLSSVLSGKHTTGSSSSYTGLPTPPGSPKFNFNGIGRDKDHDKDREQREQSAALAVLAGQTLLRKLGGAFWDAFSGQSQSTAVAHSPSTGTGGKSWDVDKVRRVLEGKAVVRVVDVEPSTSPVSVRPSSMSSLTMGMTNMSLGDEGKKDEKRCRCTEILEESMRSLTLTKKA
ncbi:hypothetical protein APHAL10511_003337 [Amanita phalloides]|nr:hypothetical protein APHAL10511_003337 [Amanita phalloides]